MDAYARISRGADQWTFIGAVPPALEQRETPQPGWCPPRQDVVRYHHTGTAQGWVEVERPDGTRYGLHWYYQRHAIGDWQRVEMQGGVEHADGKREPFAALVPELSFRDDNRRCVGGTLRCVTVDGGERPVLLAPAEHLVTSRYVNGQVVRLDGAIRFDPK